MDIVTCDPNSLCRGRLLLLFAFANSAWKLTCYSIPSCVPMHCLCFTLWIFFLYTFSFLLIPTVNHYFCCKWFVAFCSSTYCPSFCSLSAHPFFFFPAFPPNILSQPFHHLLSENLSPITPPSLLHHSIFVLVQLQKWDLAVTNLLAKPPRAPCGGTSSERTRDWLNLGKTLSGWPSWLDLLPDNKFPPYSSTVGRYTCHVVHFHDTWCLDCYI